MLVVTRRAGESLRIGDEIVVTVVGSKGGLVRVGIDAPRDVPILREEVAARIREENLAAAAAEALPGGDEDSLRRIAERLQPGEPGRQGEPPARYEARRSRDVTARGERASRGQGTPRGEPASRGEQPQGGGGGAPVVVRRRSA